MATDTPPGGRPRRADAERNAVTIIDAGLDCLAADPQASMSAIARAAGVSRVTLYAHFASRESLIEAALDRSVGEAVSVFAEEAADTAPADVALARLIRSSWRILDRHSALFAAVSATLTPDRMREQHQRVLGPIRRLLLDGQTAGTIRADLPADWLVTVLYSLVHAAAAEVQAGRLTAEAAPEVLTTTILAAVRP